MPRSLDNPELSAIRIDDDILANVFASPPLKLDRLFDDPIVRKRIGEIISVAAKRPRRRRRHRRSF
jgi:hypothetical protein